ncbi:type III pantothenate kinase [Permianibacter sp. IMCC34836]|uniref:type III pantothenate kinase n=1 Tax=Permianibacter fluminis TaxID=2738515 RepID=UPI0015534888|nr:type III pantothenate kinase [Permianibacter fluminis]NQD38394.1 type III pantothenate kinase [Permianibacter fluminis]
MLWLDVGNTRIKWQLDSADGVIAGAALHGSGDTLAAAPIWAELPARTEVWVASVASATLRAQIDALCAQAGCASVHWAVSAAHMGGLHNSYAEPARLGVDRWLAMLAAWREACGPVVVIDAGSAITVDWVDEHGRHRGGHIVPGVSLLEQALRRGTAAVRAEPQTSRSVSPGVSTDQAVNQGVLAMAAGYLRYVLTEAWPGCASARLLLCGGDGPLLEPFLPRPASWRAQLVLDGLREYARLHEHRE